jgi:hypothetical protein
MVSSLYVKKSLLAFIEADQASIADTGFAEYGLSDSLIDSK